MKTTRPGLTGLLVSELIRLAVLTTAGALAMTALGAAILAIKLLGL
jgi:hypothetical protein